MLWPVMVPVCVTVGLTGYTIYKGADVLSSINKKN